MHVRSSSLIAVVLVSAFAVSAKAAFISACQLDKLPAPEGYSAEVLKNYKQKLGSECYLQKRYDKAAATLAGTYKSSIEDVAEYKTLRFVERSAFQNAKWSETPVPYIYQAKKQDYNLPLKERSTEIWRNWTAGIQQLEGWQERRLAGVPITLDELSTVHRGFYKYSEERGDYANDPNIGQMKPAYDKDSHWFKILPEDVARTEVTIRELNERYKVLDLLPKIDEDMPLAHLPLRLEKESDGVYIYGGDTRRNHIHLRNLFAFMNGLLKQGASGQHMVWNGQLMTPGEVALTAQQFFVHIHPYNDGNGRLSRFIQESVLQFFGLPHLSSGDLMLIDVLTNHENYYYIAMGKTFEQFDKIENCISNVYPRVLPKGGDLKSVKAESIDYECRILGAF